MKQQRPARAKQRTPKPPPLAARARPTSGARPAGTSAAPSTDPEFPLSPALDFLQRLWKLNHALEKLSNQMERHLGVTAPQRMIVRCIGKYPSITPSQLAALLHLDPGTISATLSRLEDKGFVSRRRDTNDKRRVFLNLTVKGKRLDTPSAGTVESGMERLLAGAPPRDIAVARKLFEQLTGVLVDELATVEQRGATSRTSKQPTKVPRGAGPRSKR